MKTILRKGSLVIIERDNGELWLTRRFKKKKDGHRRRLTKRTIRYAPIIRIPKKGDWLFTCKNYPVQFEKSLDEYNLEDWFNYPETKETPFNDFQTIDGSCHAWQGCSLKLISEKYANWYIEHKIFDMFYNKEDTHIWQNMEQKVRDLCRMCYIQYEGI